MAKSSCNSPPSGEDPIPGLRPPNQPRSAARPPRAKKHPSAKGRQKMAIILGAQESVPPEPPTRALQPLGMMEALNLEISAKQAAKGKPPALITHTLRVLGNLVLVALALTPAFVTTHLISTYSVNTPYGDDWNLVDHLENLHHDQLEWREVYRPVDGERSPLPQLLHIGALRLTGGDLRADAWMNLTWISLTSLAVLLLLLRTIGGGFAMALLYFIANLSLFSPAQNLFAMRQAGILLPVACLVWAHLFASFHISTVLKFAACAFLAATAAASGIYGLSLLATVPILACFAVGLPCRVRPWIFALAWGIFAAVLLRLYLFDWNPLASLFSPIPPGMEITPRLERGFSTGFKLLASPLIEGWGWASPAARIALGTALAAMLLGMAAWTLLATIGRHRPMSGVRCSPWLLLGISGLTGVALIAVARLCANPLGPPPTESAVNLGHAAIPVILGTLVPFYVLARESIHRIRPYPLRILPAVLLASILGSVIGLQSESWFRGQESVRQEHRERLRARVALHLSRVFAPDDPVAFGSADTEVLLRRAQFLHNAGYLNPLLLHLPNWPERRVAPLPLSLLEARVDRYSEAPSFRFRILARVPSPLGQAQPAAGVLLACKDPLDETQYRLVAAASPDPANPAAWLLDLAAKPLEGSPLEFLAIDGQTMIAHRLDQHIVRDAAGNLELERSKPVQPGIPADRAKDILRIE